MTTERITLRQIKIGDRLRRFPDAPMLTVRGFRKYRNANCPHLEHYGRTKVIDVTDDRGKSYGLTVFPGDLYEREVAAW